jgi:hypothetical protein
MYRKNAADDWDIYPYFTKNMASNSTDKHGSITIDTLKLGEYVLAMKDYTMGIGANKTITDKYKLKLFPNPAKELITIDCGETLLKSQNNTSIVITDVTGKIVYQEKITSQQSSIHIKTAAYNNGVYCVCVKANDSILATSKFIVTH